jgi:hypothetical protein
MIVDRRRVAAILTMEWRSVLVINFKYELDAAALHRFFTLLNIYSVTSLPVRA